MLTATATATVECPVDSRFLGSFEECGYTFYEVGDLGELCTKMDNEEILQEELGSLVIHDYNPPIELYDFKYCMHQYSVEVLTAAIGGLAIYLISKGSSQYGDLLDEKEESKKNQLTKEGSRHILLGNIGMTILAFTACNPRFALPEIATILTALKPFIEARSPFMKRVFNFVKLEVWIVLLALAIGAYTLQNYTTEWWHYLAPVGLTLLAIAFSFGSNTRFQKIYRFHTISGGLALVLGSTIETFYAPNLVAVIMGCAFLLLNILFTINEVREVKATHKA